MAKILILFYSRAGQNYLNGDILNLEVGNAARIAAFLKEAVDADCFEIDTKESYPEDYMTCTEVAQEELRRGARPELKETLEDITDYEDIFLCGPCWWGTYPMAVFTQLEKLNFQGKTIHPVMTHEGSGMGNAVKDVKKACPGAKVTKGLAVQGGAVVNSEKAIKAWAQKEVRA